mgnify:CR=1 FL=1
MTDKEISKIRKEIPRFENGVPCNLTLEEKQLHRELDCRDMINSCLCYGQSFINSHYSHPYIKDLGMERVLELYNEQKTDFDKAKVLYNVGEDGEGNTYHSIKWADEIETDIEDEINY